MVSVRGWVQRAGCIRLHYCPEKVLMRRKASGDTSQRWFGAQIADLPSASTSAGRGGARISNAVEEGQVEYLLLKSSCQGFQPF